MKIEEAPVQVLAAIPVEESDVEKAKQDLTVNVLRVMMVPPGVQKIFIHVVRVYHLVGHVIKLDTWKTPCIWIIEYGTYGIYILELEQEFGTELWRFSIDHSSWKEVSWISRNFRISSGKLPFSKFHNFHNFSKKRKLWKNCELARKHSPYHTWVDIGFKDQNLDVT